MSVISSALLRVTPLFLFLAPADVTNLPSNADAKPPIALDKVTPYKEVAGRAKVQKSSAYTFVNKGSGQVKTVLMGVDLSFNGELVELQKNFLKEFCSRNPQSKVILLYDPRCNINNIKKSLTDIVVLKNVCLIQTKEGQSYRWTQDPVVFLNNPDKNEIVALSNANCSFPKALLDSNIVSNVITPANSNVLIDGGDFRAIAGPDGPILIIGLERKLMGKSRDPKSVIAVISEYINEFSLYGFRPENIIFRGGNPDEITFNQALKNMPQEELQFLHPSIFIMGDQEIPTKSFIGYHSDLQIFETGIRDKKERPILMISKPLILYDKHFQALLSNTKNEEEKLQLRQSQKWWNNIYEKENKRYIDRGFSVRPLPFGEITKKDDRGVCLVNYTNVVSNTNLNKKREIYLPVQGNDHYFDVEAINVYRNVYGNSADIIPVIGSEQMGPDCGLLNCLFNVVERQ